MMEKLSSTCQEKDQMDLPPGFRFHPTDEELISHYLLNKVVDYTFVAKPIGEVDLNKIEPWDLPKRAKTGENVWYFYSVRDKKYPTGLRTNRATAAGYWKATGKDKEIFKARSLIGMKKTLVFYIGRAPKGEKSNWVIHEYRLEGQFSQKNLPKSAKTEWVISRVFHKKSSENKVNISGLITADSGGRIINQSISESNHVHCFSNPVFPSESNPNPLLESQSIPIMHQFPSGYPLSVRDHTILSDLIGTYGHGSQDTGVSSDKNTDDSSTFEKGKRGIENQEAPSTSIGPVDLDCQWNYWNQ